MLVELGLVEQRYRAVLEVVNDGASVTDVARRFGVARQTVHVWLRAYAGGGLAALVVVAHEVGDTGRGVREG
ncbi:helix-turn-helix domain-containing protein [Cellulomonas sp. KRMCY2]|uniref:helix-turn-helix domain-containing protein n=1 Tax=Cellulomonas sp. KRMCY2 TaxID=1304865 RepID=UPI0004B283A5|nr:helix-turn-helix domain-containing protein [Cellulomonas sp. KRMCY2]